MSNLNNQPLFCLVPNSSDAQDVLTLKENRPHRKGPAKRFLDFPYFIFGPSRPSKLKQPGMLAALGTGKEENDIWLGNDNRNGDGYRRKQCVLFLDHTRNLHIRSFTGAWVYVVLCDTEQHGFGGFDDKRPRKNTRERFRPSSSRSSNYHLLLQRRSNPPERRRSRVHKATESPLREMGRGPDSRLAALKLEQSSTETESWVYGTLSSASPDHVSQVWAFMSLKDYGSSSSCSEGNTILVSSSSVSE
ncbi:hypothetical protein N657DRAFT_668148 [Parathielavia appendiculata]|uniref:Uncharacterized protein n=1 Tax=Parathielavia appendiculata TaxID=2587402 RepID=A0AAN6UAJ3_9PEZI|nr:hypothetical protein N657DRAFT_668148 [Parathielavia appendiculata]